MLSRLGLRFGLLLLLLCLGASSAGAQPQVVIDASGGDPPQELQDQGVVVGPDADGRFYWTFGDVQPVFEGGQEVGRIEGWTVSWSEDSARAELAHNLTLTNTSAVTRSYSARVRLPVQGLAYSEIAASSVGATLLDRDGNGAAQLGPFLAAPLYQARVDAVDRLALDPGTLSESDCAPLAGAAGCSATASDGIAALAASGTASELEIELRFSLSAGDSVGLTSRFEIAAPAAGVGSGEGPAVEARSAGPDPVFTSGLSHDGANRAIHNLISVTNSLDFDALYIVSVTASLASFAYDSIEASSIGVSATDANGDGTLRFTSDGSSPIYQAKVDNQTVLSLDPGDLLASDCALAPGQPGCTATSSDNVDQWAASGEADEIEILLRFVLGPGDAVAVTSRLELMPEPSAVAGLAACAGLLGGLSRRRRAARGLQR